MKIPYRQADDRVVLHLLGEPDAPWIAAILDEVEASIEQPWRVLLERWRSHPPGAHPARAAAIVAALRRALSGRARHGLLARKIRRHTLGAPALDPVVRATRVATAAAQLELDPAELATLMWADLPGERLVTMPRGRPPERTLCAAANLAIVQRALARAFDVRLRVIGNPRPLVRLAALAGLIHTAHREAGATVISLSGPLSLFHQTTVYGRALGRLVPALAWCDHFELVARCDLGRGPAMLRLVSPLVLPPAPPPRRFDSAVELRFARDLPKATRAWRVRREPEAVPSGEHLVFPDFVLEHRDDPTRRWWLEIVGFWTTDYLAHKLARYHAAGLANLILCIEANRVVGDADLPHGAHVVRFSRRVPVADVLAIVDVRGC